MEEQHLKILIERLTNILSIEQVLWNCLPLNPNIIYYTWMASTDRIFRKMCGVKLTSLGEDVLESNSETHPRGKYIMEFIQCMCLLKEIDAYACRTHLLQCMCPLNGTYMRGRSRTHSIASRT